jgi:hypothetical protein
MSRRLPCPQGRRQHFEERQHLPAPTLLLNDYLLGGVDLEHVLGDIQTDRCNFGDRSLMDWLTTINLSELVVGSGHRPPH